MNYVFNCIDSIQHTYIFCTRNQKYLYSRNQRSSEEILQQIPRHKQSQVLNKTHFNVLNMFCTKHFDSHRAHPSVLLSPHPTPRQTSRTDLGDLSEILCGSGHRRTAASYCEAHLLQTKSEYYLIHHGPHTVLISNVCVNKNGKYVIDAY